MISYSTGYSGSGDDVEKCATRWRSRARKRPDLLSDGPMQYDAASVESVGRQKAPGSQVAGRATVFVFPDLNTGNTTYKAVQRSAHVVSGHCQVNRSQNELAPARPMGGASSRLLDACLLLPDPKGFRPGAAIMAGAEAVTLWPEMAVDDGVRREEILRLAGCICPSRRRVGRCEFSARLFK
jgi:hypothetical protein